MWHRKETSSLLWICVKRQLRCRVVDGKSQDWEAFLWSWHKAISYQLIASVTEIGFVYRTPDHFLRRTLPPHPYFPPEAFISKKHNYASLIMTTSVVLVTVTSQFSLPPPECGCSSSHLTAWHEGLSPKNHVSLCCKRSSVCQVWPQLISRSGAGFWSADLSLLQTVHKSSGLTCSA